MEHKIYDNIMTSNVISTVIEQTAKISYIVYTQATVNSNVINETLSQDVIQ